MEPASYEPGMTGLLINYDRTHSFISLERNNDPGID